jgi:hypothetical protein
MNTLPTNWYIEVTRENQAELNRWRKKVATEYRGHTVRVGHALLSRHEDDGSYYFAGDTRSVRSQDAYKDYQEITLEQFRAITNPVPEHWYIVATEDNYDELEAWRQTVARGNYNPSFRIGHPLLSEHPKDDSYYYGGSVNSLKSEPKFDHYREITLEQFRQITNSKPMSKPEVKTIQIHRTLLNEYYDAATTPQKEYLSKHFKLDGTTTDEAIRGLYELACNKWKPIIKANHSECFPEESKYFDFSKHTNLHGCDSIVLGNVAESLGLYRNFIEVRSSNTENNDRSFYLDRRYNWELVNEGGDMVLIPTKKVK